MKNESCVRDFARGWCMGNFADEGDRGCRMYFPVCLEL